MNKLNRLLVFSLDEERYALHLNAVKMIVRAVEVTPLPQAPDNILGLINIKGQVIPVFNVRRRFKQPKRSVELNNRFIIARTQKRTVALVVDSVAGIVEPAEGKLIPAEKITPKMELFDGVIKLEDDMVLIHDLDRFLSLEEETILDRAMEETRGSKG